MVCRGIAVAPPELLEVLVMSFERRWVYLTILMFSVSSLLAMKGQEGMVNTQLKSVSSPMPEPVQFVPLRSLILRDKDRLITVMSDATLTLDENYLKEKLKTGRPTPAQVQELLLDPSRFQLQPEHYYDSQRRRNVFEYFYPVQVKQANGVVITGRMALRADFFNGYLRLQNGSSASVPLELAMDSDAEVRGGYPCEQCSSSYHQKKLKAVSEFAENLISPLWQEYVNFAREFSLEHGSKIRANSAGYYKRLYLKKLVEKFGPAQAGQIIRVMTAYGEAPDRDEEDVQIAELAAIMKVIDNRVENGFWASPSSRLIRDCGREVTEDPYLRASLANGQFSVWNNNDQNLIRVLKFNPDSSQPAMKRRMVLAFSTQAKMERNEIEFIGGLAGSDVLHYHANYTWPVWARRSKAISQALVRVNSLEQGRSVSFEVDLNLLPGARHVFYEGLR